MELTINIDTHKSNLFLDLLQLLKKDNMINDYEIISSPSKLSAYEEEVLEDIQSISTAIESADTHQGQKKDITLKF